MSITILRYTGLKSEIADEVVQAIQMHSTEPRIQERILVLSKPK